MKVKLHVLHTEKLSKLMHFPKALCKLVPQHVSSDINVGTAEKQFEKHWQIL